MVGAPDSVPSRDGLSSWFCHQPFRTICHLSRSVKRDTYLSSLNLWFPQLKLMSQILSWLNPTKSYLKTEIATNAFTPYCAQINKWVKKIHLVPKTYKQISLRPPLQNITIRNILNHEDQEWKRKGVCQDPTTPPLPFSPSQGPAKASSNHLPAEELGSPC